MNRITTKDGTSIFYKDWGPGPTGSFLARMPLNADAWDAQMLFLGQQGYRVVAHDRRGHGRSEQTWTGNEYDTFADDLKDVTLVGHPWAAAKSPAISVVRAISASRKL